MTQPIAIVFPGQGSQSIGMSRALAEAFPLVRHTYQEASDALGLDLWKLVDEGPAEDLNRTENTQPAMLTAGVAVWRVWKAQGGADPLVMAGHSLGEYSALVAGGALPLARAVTLVADRGRYMQNAVPEGEGAMAAILGLDDDQVRELCRAAAGDEVVEAVNFNAPGQVVIAGRRAAVERAMALAKEKGAKRALPLPVSVPSHSSLMEPAAKRLAARLDAEELEVPRIPVLHNVDVAPAATLADLVQKLVAQLHNPVRWVETIQAMPGRGVEKVLEFGPGKVLTGLGKRIDKQLDHLPVFDPASLEKALEASHV